MDFGTSGTESSTKSVCITSCLNNKRGFACQYYQMANPTLHMNKMYGQIYNITLILFLYFFLYFSIIRIPGPYSRPTRRLVKMKAHRRVTLQALSIDTALSISLHVLEKKG